MLSGKTCIDKEQNCTILILFSEISDNNIENVSCWLMRTDAAEPHEEGRLLFYDNSAGDLGSLHLKSFVKFKIDNPWINFTVGQKTNLTHQRDFKIQVKISTHVPEEKERIFIEVLWLQENKKLTEDEIRQTIIK